MRPGTETIQPRPIIALLTDFGYTDWFVASMKGTIQKICPDADLVDITHAIEPHQVEQAAFVLECVYQSFPVGTIFLAVVDPGVGTQRVPVIISAGGWTFTGPDNGLFGFLRELHPELVCHVISEERFLSKAVSATFHGRDLFAPCAAALASGTDPESLAAGLKTPETLPGTIETPDAGRIVHFDHFGNAITSIKSAKARDAAVVRLHTRTTTTELSLLRTYGDVPEGSGLAYPGSTGRIEIGINSGNAKMELGLQLGDRVELAGAGL